LVAQILARRVCQCAKNVDLTTPSISQADRSDSPSTIAAQMASASIWVSAI
jgi:hypothetical protein